MADQTFDVVIVGGGNKALILAMYLTKYAKMEVGIFEERHELGGGWSCEEPSAGYMGNTCSMAHMAHYHVPVYQDFPEWKDYGARYSYTQVSMGTAFKEDDTCFLQYNAFPDCDPSQEKTAANIAKFSERDADTYLKLWKKTCDHWIPAFLEHMFTPAVPMGQPDAFDRLAMNPDAGIEPVWGTYSPLQIFQDLFEDTHLRQGSLRAIQSWGFQADQAGAGLGALMGVMALYPFHCYVVGSSHALAHASHKVIIENGGKIFTNYRVEKVLVENGRARGIRLADGSEIEAKKFVATTVDPYQLCIELLDKDRISGKIRRRVENLERDWIALMWYTWAFKEKPHYKASAFDSGADDCMWLALGDLDLETFKNESSERKMHKWPSKMNLGIAYHGPSEVDSSDQCLGSPSSPFTVLTEQFVVPAWALSDAEWKKWEQRHAEEVIELWGQYAPNVTWDNVSGYIPVTPYYTANMARNFAPAGNWCVIDNIPSQSGRMRPLPELAGHKIPGLDGLYCTGSGWHPWGAGHSAQGYNCYKVIAEDLGLIKPWDKEGRPY